VHDFVVHKNAAFVKKHFPSVGWIQIDEGYQIRSDKQTVKDPDNPDTGFGRERIAHYHYLEDENAGISERKFPQGMRECADNIRSLGLRPAIWTGLSVAPGAKVAVDHPDWFQDNLEMGGACNALNPDVSIPDCMKVIKEGFVRLVREYGFEGIKLDFWTHAFVSNQRPYAKPMRFSQGNKTGLEYMHELLGELRDLLGDGYLETGCDISCGNPFLGQYVDNFRFGIDIAEGEWKRVVFAARMAAFLVSATHPLGYLANADSIGVLPGLGDEERRTWMHFCFISGTMCEVAGDFANTISEIDSEYLRECQPDLLGKRCECSEAILEEIQNVGLHVNNGGRVLLTSHTFLEGGSPPAVWIKCDQSGEPVYVALFNWGDRFTQIDLELDRQSIHCSLVDFHDPACVIDSCVKGLGLPAHASRLFRVRGREQNG